METNVLIKEINPYKKYTIITMTLSVCLNFAIYIDRITCSLTLRFNELLRIVLKYIDTSFIVTQNCIKSHLQASAMPNIIKVLLFKEGAFPKSIKQINYLKCGTIFPKLYQLIYSCTYNNQLWV